MSMNLSEENNITEMKKSDFSFSNNLETVPYLNNNGDIIQDKLEEIEKNTKSIQENLVASNEENVEFVCFEK